MPYIYNTVQYRAIMANVSRNAMERCLDKARADLQQTMLKDIYSAYTPTDYFRTYQLLDAWKCAAAALQGSLQFSAVFGLQTNRELGQHTSIMGQGSLGNALIDVLEEGYKGFNAKRGKAIPARPFWDRWITNRASRYIGAWYRDGLEEQGFFVEGR